MPPGYSVRMNIKRRVIKTIFTCTERSSRRCLRAGQSPTFVMSHARSMGALKWFPVVLVLIAHLSSARFALRAPHVRWPHVSTVSSPFTNQCRAATCTLLGTIDLAAILRTSGASQASLWTRLEPACCRKCAGAQHAGRTGRLLIHWRCRQRG